MSNAQVFIIICHDKETDIFEELSGAYVNRQLAEQAKKNLNLNFDHYVHSIKVLNLHGVSVDTNNSRLYRFPKIENE